MNFTLNAEQVMNRFKTIVKGFDPKDDSSYIYFKINEKDIVLTAGSIGAYFTGTIPHSQLDNDEEKVFYVHGETLRQLLSVFPADSTQITFSFNEKTRIFNIKYPGHKLQLPIESEFTPKPEPKIKKLGHIQSTDLLVNMNDLLKIVPTNLISVDSAAGCLNLITNPEENKMYLFATDTFVMAEVTVDFASEDEKADEENILIKQNQALLLNKICFPGEILTLIKTDSQFGYIDNDGTTALVGTVNLDPLSYAAIKESAGGETFFTISKSELKAALDSLSKLSFGNTELTLKIDSKKITVCNQLQNDIDVAITDTNNEEEISLDTRIEHLASCLIPNKHSTIKFLYNPSEDTNKIIRVESVDDTGTDEDVFVAMISKRTETE